MTPCHRLSVTPCHRLSVVPCHRLSVTPRHRHRRRRGHRHRLIVRFVERCCRFFPLRYHVDSFHWATQCCQFDLAMLWILSTSEPCGFFPLGGAVLSALFSDVVDSFHFRAVWILSARRLSGVRFVSRCCGFFGFDVIIVVVVVIVVMNITVRAVCFWCGDSGVVHAGASQPGVDPLCTLLSLRRNTDKLMMASGTPRNSSCTTTPV